MKSVSNYCNVSSLKARNNKYPLLQQHRGHDRQSSVSSTDTITILSGQLVTVSTLLILVEKMKINLKALHANLRSTFNFGDGNRTNKKSTVLHCTFTIYFIF